MLQICSNYPIINTYSANTEIALIRKQNKNIFTGTYFLDKSFPSKVSRN